MNGRRCSLVLAFYPHARGFAYVVFEGPRTPVDWGMSDLPGKQKARRCLRRLELLIDQYQPDALVLRKVSCRRGMTDSAKLFRAIRELAENKGLRAASFSRKQIQEAFEDLGSPTRYAIVEEIAQHIRPFAAFVPPARKIWNGEDRRMGLFDAASLVLTYFHSVGGGEQRAA